MYSTHPLTHAEFTTPTELLQPGFFLQGEEVFSASSSQNGCKSLTMMRSFLATSVIELFHDSNVACHHGDTQARQAGMETADDQRQVSMRSCMK